VRSLNALVAALCLSASFAQAAPKPAKPAPPAIPSPAAEAAQAPRPADPVVLKAQALNNEWAEIFYRLPSNAQAEKYYALLPRIREFKAQNPTRAEPLIIEAITLCTLAAADWGFSSLGRIGEARELLEKSIDLDPTAMEASAFLTLGNLYYRLPGWPFSFGDEDQAREYYEMALKLFPEGLDTNYFLGDYWLNEEEYDKALIYLEKADTIPPRPSNLLSDGKMKAELQKALKAARNRDSGHSDFFTDMTPDFKE